MDEYIYKLNAAFKVALVDYLTEQTEHSRGNFLLIISSIVWVDSNPYLGKIKLHQLISGNELIIFFDGTVNVDLKQENGTTRKRVNFMCRECPVMWDPDEEDFDVGPIPEFIIAGIQ